MHPKPCLLVVYAALCCIALYVGLYPNGCLLIQRGEAGNSKAATNHPAPIPMATQLDCTWLWEVIQYEQFIKGVVWHAGLLCAFIRWRIGGQCFVECDSNESCVTTACSDGQAGIKTKYAAMRASGSPGWKRMGGVADPLPHLSVKSAKMKMCMKNGSSFIVTGKPAPWFAITVTAAENFVQKFWKEHLCNYQNQT